MTLSGAQVSIQKRYQLLSSAGFNQGSALVMTALSTLECASCSLDSVNASGDIGLMQINRQHWGSSDPRRSVYGDLTDPAVSARAAFALWSSASRGGANPTAGFQQWCTYPGGCGGAKNVPNQISAAAFNALVSQVAAAVQGTPVAEPGPAAGGDTPPVASAPPTSQASAGGCDFTPQDCSQITGPRVGPADFTGIARALCGAQNGLGQVGQFFCNLGSVVHYFTVRGHLWQIAFVIIGLVMVLFGVNLYLGNPAARAAGQVARLAAA